MRVVNLKVVFGLLIGVSLMFQSCKKEEDDDSQFIRWDDVSIKNNGCKLSINGTTEGGYVINEIVNYDYINSERGNEFVEDDSTINFDIYQSPSKLGSYQRASLELTFNKITGKARCTEFDFEYDKLIDANNILEINENYYSGGFSYNLSSYGPSRDMSVELLSYSFDRTTNIFKCTLTSTIQYFISDAVTRTLIVNAEFNTKVVKLNK